MGKMVFNLMLFFITFLKELNFFSFMFKFEGYIMWNRLSKKNDGVTGLLFKIHIFKHEEFPQIQHFKAYFKVTVKGQGH